MMKPEIRTILSQAGVPMYLLEETTTGSLIRHHNLPRNPGAVAAIKKHGRSTYFGYEF